MQCKVIFPGHLCQIDGKLLSSHGVGPLKPLLGRGQGVPPRPVKRREFLGDWSVLGALFAPGDQPWTPCLNIVVFSLCSHGNLCLPLSLQIVIFSSVPTRRTLGKGLYFSLLFSLAVPGL